MCSHQRIRIIELCPPQQVKAARVHQNPGTRLLDHQIVGSGRRLIQVKLILKAAASPREYGHPQGGRSRLAAQYLGDARHGTLGQAKIRRIGAHDHTIAL